MAVNTEDFKDKIREHLFDNLEQMFADIETLPAKDRVDRRLKLMDFVIAKVQSEQVKYNNKSTNGEELLAKEAEYVDDSIL